MSVDATGITIRTAVEIEDAINAAIDASPVLGTGIRTDQQSPLGQLIAIFATQLATAEQLNLEVYNALNPDAALGAQLDATCALAPLTRDPATKSVGELTISGTDSTFIPVGYVARIPLGARFVTTASGTITGGSVTLAIESEDTGPITASAAQITEPVTIVAGVSSVSNTEAVTPGRNLETDEELRQRREGSLAVSGSGTDASVGARLAELDTVEQALVISNRSAVVDEFGIPPYWARPIVWPAQSDNQPIFDTLWEHNCLGIGYDGAITGTVTDSQGLSQPVAYSVATELEVHVEIVVTTDPVTYGGDAAVAAAVVAAQSSPRVGADLLLWRLENRVGDDVTGVLTIEARAKVGSAPSPSDTINISVPLDSIATIDLANVDVTSS